MVLKCLHPVCLQILAVLTVLVTISYGKVFDSIVCNGVNPSCATHHLICPYNTTLVIKKAQYGYVVPQAQCGSVTTTCTNWRTCCRYDKSDCLVDFTASDMSKIYECSGLSYCKILPPPRGVAGNCSDNKDYVYSRIQHGCSNASVIINLSDKTKQEINKNQVIIKYDKYKKK
ncbi:hypothetical protein SNE40_020766 [Patella caerulea]|uniref:Uncharacterized protein n=1 Tax=Patella caerulea TaxID=87958 RepID=A0AAN8J5B5_PATCE